MAESRTGSGDSSKVAARVVERANATNALSGDPKFKKYTSQVDKCLATFESVHEWADFIAFLTKLLKTLQSYPQFKEIPRKLIVGKRLAQCLNPALPTGVHQRALDVYSQVLGVLGPEGLKRDLQIWSAGLFPFFGYSATSVRPTLLNIYETHYLALKAGLRPVMKAFILALLPGLEEENGESFEKVLSILDRLAGTVSQAFFLQNIWLVLLTAPSSRGTAITYLSRRFPKLGDDADVSSIIGRDIGLMVRAFAASLEDDDILVRRGILELLNQSFKIDCKSFKSSHADDQESLMRAAAAVVLRRDLSLSRRLYSWLLGSDESSETQIAYFRKHGLELLRKTLCVEMYSCPGGVPDPRPYKIFISLLDKWEIGSPLTEVLIIDSLKALAKHVKDQKLVSDADILMTASTLYEVIEPNALWKPLFSSAVNELTSGTSGMEAIEMVRFVLRVFRAHDDEVVHVHLPIVFTAFTELISIMVSIGQPAERMPIIRDTLHLLQSMLGQISTGTLSRPIDLPGDQAPTTNNVAPLSRGLEFYSTQVKSFEPATTSRNPIPLVTAFEDLLSISSGLATLGDSDKILSSSTLECLSVALSILVGLVARLDDRLKAPLQLSWAPMQWLASMMSVLDEATFELLDRVITAAIAVAHSNYIRPSMFIDHRPVMTRMMSGLLRFLQSQWVPYHVRAVQLIWSLEGATKYHHVQSIVAGTLIDVENQCKMDAFDAFGVLWRLTDDSLMPGFHFKIPMMTVLDTLKSEDTNRRRVAETWMRCCLKSYLRVLDPILFDLVDPSIRRVSTTFTYQRREIRGFIYERPIDQRRIHHLLESLLSVVRFGGQGFSKVARMTPLKKSPKVELLGRAEAASVAHEAATYMEVLIEVLLRFIQSEPKESTSRTMVPGNVQVQASALDLVQAIVSRGDVDPLILDNVEAAIICKLYAAVHCDRLDLQNKLLHVLHSVILASSVVEQVAPNQKARPYRSPEIPNHLDDMHSAHQYESAPNSPVKVNPLLVQTLLDGLSRPASRPILQHWIDFVLMTVPQFQRSLSHLIFPLCDCIARQLRIGLEDVVHVYLDQSETHMVKSSTTDADFIMLLNVLERMVLLGLTKSDTPAVDEEPQIQEKMAPESSGLLGLVSNVFGAETSGAPEEYLAPRSPGYYCLDEAVRILYAIWIMTTPVPKENAGPAAESTALIFARVRMRCRKVLERLFRAQSGEVLESLVECWHRTDEIIQPALKANGTFEIVDILSASAQTVVHMLCESISYRITPAVERTRKIAINPNLSDAYIFVFLEEYIRRLEGPIANQVWNRYLVLAKEVSSNVHVYKRQVFPALRCFAVLSEKVCQTTAIEERRMRKEMQDTMTKLSDTCILIAGRSFEQNNWIRRSGKDSLPIDRASTPIPRVLSELNLNEKGDGISTPVDDGQRSSWGPDLVDQINEFIIITLLPNLRRFLAEPDKILALCTNIVYYVVNPAMKSKNRVLEVDNTILEILTEMVKIPAAVKAWRPPIAEAFNDNRFFNSTPIMSPKWRPLVRALMDSDKLVFGELIAKVTTAPSANIFTNREYEMLLRSLNLRRLSYVLFAGERNQYLGQLPGIQEKLVDILRGGNVAPVVTSEVYLCLRVLLCRLSEHNMNSFWPVILTEMLRVFEQCVSAPPPDGSDELAVVLAACRFLDLVLVLQTDEFQVHQWMFVTDTVDAVYRPESWIPEAVMDQLAEIIGDMPDVKGHTDASNGITKNGHSDDAHRPVLERLGSGITAPAQQRRPLLSSVRSIDSIKDLVPFFSHVSLFSYESVYGSAVAGLAGGSGGAGMGVAAAVDWASVERSLVEEMFEGR